jgi:lipopolysaccharide/colanic/teichoic acid biosynthesis glycosyltransferase
VAEDARPLTASQRALKRTLDMVLAAVGLLAVGWLIPVLAGAARRDTGASGIFHQARVGRHGAHFRVHKLRTMRPDPAVETTVTTAGDVRITKLGARLRRWNVLRGEMSFVGPRPDVPGWYDRLEPPFDVLLSLRPGITGPATLAFRDEELLLREQQEPEQYNRVVIFPAKLELNMAYLRSWSVVGDVRLILETIARRG